MAFSQDFISKVLEANDIVGVIGQDTQLKGRGSQFMGLCPFPNHRERTPSFSVSQDKQVYHCFGCKKSGNLVTYLEEMRGLSFPEAIEFLANKAGIPVPLEEGEKEAPRDQTRDLKKQLYKVNETASVFFHHHLLRLPDEHPLRNYLHKRNISLETIAQFQVGYAPDSWDELALFLKEQNLSLDQAESLGLVRARTKGKSGHYDIFRHRLMFPIVSPSGSHLGFGGRVLRDEQPKYINSPESEIFHKGKVLYGLQETAKFIRSEDRVIVVEGYTDFLALYQAGIQNAVATLGTALTEHHARLIRRYTKNVVVLFDSDEAGQLAAERSLPILLSQGLYPKGIVLPGAKDPDEFLRTQGMENFRELLEQSKDLFIEIFEKKSRQGGNEASDKVKILDELQPILASMADFRLRDLYINEMALRWNQDRNWILGSLRGRGEVSMPKPTLKISEPARPADSPKTGTEGSKIQLKGAPKAELWLVNGALMSVEAWKAVSEADILPFLTHEGIRQVLVRIDELYRQMPSKFDSLTSLLMAEVEPAGDLALHMQPSFQLSEEGAQKLILDCIRKVKQVHSKNELRKISTRLRENKGSEARKDLEQIMNIHRERWSSEKEN